MKIEIDTDTISWTEVPGKPTVGSFLRLMQNPQRDGKDAPATKLPWMYGFVLIKIETPTYDAAARDFGRVPTGTEVTYRMIQFPRCLYYGGEEFPEYGAERIIAYTKVVDQAIDRVIGALLAAPGIPTFLPTSETP